MRLTRSDGREVFQSSTEADLMYIRPIGKLAFQSDAPEWPQAVPLRELPPLASRLDLRALPSRLGLAARVSTRGLALAVVLGASPLWGGFLVSLLVSAYAIPSQSMESTLAVGDGAPHSAK